MICLFLKERNKIHILSKDKYNNLKLQQVNAAAKQVVKPDNLTWMIVGDKKEIVKQLKDVDLGTMIFMDADGNVLK